VPLAPFAAFVVWYVVKGRSGSASPSVHLVLRVLWTTATHAAGSFAGHAGATGGLVGDVVVVGLALGVVAALVRRPARAARLAMAVVGALSFWVLTAVARGNPFAGYPRYLYPSAVLLVLAAAELPGLLFDWSPGGGRASSTGETRRLPVVATTVLVVLALGWAGLSLWWNAGPVADWSTFLTGVSTVFRAELGATTVAGRALPATFQPDRVLGPQVTAGPYDRAVAAYGSPGDDLGQLEALPAGLGTQVDAMLLRGRPFTVRPRPVPPPAARSCRAMGRTASGSVVVPLPAAGRLVVTAPAGSPVTLGARAFAPAASPIAVIPAGGTVTVRWPASGVPWQIVVTPTAAGVLPAAARCAP
jgi:hypothetical protein